MSQSGSLLSPGGTTSVTTISGNTGTATPTGGNINIVTANSTPIFAASGSTITLDFGLTNLLLGVSGSSISGASHNVSLGRFALNALTSGIQNTATGYQSQLVLTTGNNNVSQGQSSLSSLIDGNQNTAIGVNSLGNSNHGSSNTSVGYSSGSGGLTTGSFNIFFGQGAGDLYHNADSSNIAIGNVGVATESNTIRIGTQGSGSGQQNLAFLAGITGVTVAASAPVGVASTGQLSSLGFGTSGQFFISNGAGVSPTFQSAGSLVGTTITGDTGGALSPTAGNWNILGDTNTVKTTGSGSTLTVGLQTQILQPAGTAAAPSYSIQGSTGIGMFSSAGNTLAFAANGTNLLELQGNGTIHPKGPVLLESGLGYNVTLPAGSTTTTVNDGFIGVDTTAARTITLVAAPDFGQIYRIQDITGSGATNNITIAGNGKLINGSASYTISTNYGAADLTYDGVAWFATASTISPANTKITTFTTSGTWTVDPRTKYSDIYSWGGGGGGGSGRCGATGAAGGGAGGGTGNLVYLRCLGSQLTGSPYTITIGAGGGGGGSINATTTDGNPGIVGGTTSVGTAIVAPGGAFGGGGTTGTRAGGTGKCFLNFNFTTSANGGSGPLAVASDVASIVYGYATGGGGGSGYAAATPRVGAAGGGITDPAGTVLVAGGLAGANTGALAGNGNSPSGIITIVGGTGGGGGGQDGTVTAGTGGNGAQPGGGGGGGAGNLSLNASGAGGQGGNGEIIIIEYF